METFSTISRERLYFVVKQTRVGRKTIAGHELANSRLPDLEEEKSGESVSGARAFEWRQPESAQTWRRPPTSFGSADCGQQRSTGF